MANTGDAADLEKIDKLLQNDDELSKKHYGIRNVNERLKMYYGEDCGLHYYVKDEETVVEIILPIDKLKEDL